MKKLVVLIACVLALGACQQDHAVVDTVESFAKEATGMNLVIDKSVLRVVNTDNDPDFNKLIQELDKVTIYTSNDLKGKGKSKFEMLDKSLRAEGYESSASMDSKEASFHVYSIEDKDKTSKWIVLMHEGDEIGLIDIQGELNMDYLASVKNLNMDKVRGLVNRK